MGKRSSSTFIFFKVKTVTQKSITFNSFEGEKTLFWKGQVLVKFTARGRGRGLLKDSILHKQVSCLGIKLTWRDSLNILFKESHRKLHREKNELTEQTNRENIATSEFSCLTSQEISANS